MGMSVQPRLATLAVLLFLAATLDVFFFTADAFSHTSYRECRTDLKNKLSSKCDYRYEYCGYVIVRLPRGGYETMSCVPKRKHGYACKFDDQCLSGACISPKCM